MRTNSSFHHDNVNTITDGHRVLDISNQKRDFLYTKSKFQAKAQEISYELIFEKMVPALINSMEQNVSHHLTAAALRASRNPSLNSTTKPSADEISAEILFDNTFVKVNNKNINRETILKKTKQSRISQQPLSIGIPLFSRKPVSPVKNRGYSPDIGDIYSIIRCAELMKLLSWFQEQDVCLNIFSDGFKYQRACGTPDENILDYQNGLRFWIEALEINNYVKIINYEDHLAMTLGRELYSLREKEYFTTYLKFAADLKRHFDPRFLHRSFHNIERSSPYGAEIKYVFYSIASSVYYQSGHLGKNIVNKHDLAQYIFVDYLAEIHLASLGNISHYLPDKLLSLSLLEETWEATLKYVSISLTDRHLDVWNKIQPSGIKLSIHGKPGEIQLRPTNSKFLTMTAQHSVGGVVKTKMGTKITCEYRIEREAAGEIPVILAGSKNKNVFSKKPPDTIKKMIRSGQPFCYVPDKTEDIQKIISGSYIDA